MNLGNQHQIWTGLWNRDEVTCQNEACVGKIYWLSDGGVYDEHRPEHKLSVKPRECIRFKHNVISTSSNCGGRKGFVCEFKCPEKATPTTPVASTHSKTGTVKKGACKFLFTCRKV